MALYKEVLTLRTVDTENDISILYCSKFKMQLLLLIDGVADAAEEGSKGEQLQDVEGEKA